MRRYINIRPSAINTAGLKYKGSGAQNDTKNQNTQQMAIGTGRTTYKNVPNAIPKAL